jgi:hypothetical protein
VCLSFSDSSSASGRHTLAQLLSAADRVFDNIDRSLDFPKTANETRLEVGAHESLETRVVDLIRSGVSLTRSQTQEKSMERKARPQHASSQSKRSNERVTRRRRPLLSSGCFKVVRLNHVCARGC